MAKTAGRPLIGITGPRTGAVGPRICVHTALLLAGARPVHLRPGGERLNTSLDGVVVTGGHDVEPVLYKAVSEVEGKYDRERDAFEADVIDQALLNETPLLGICRGAQLLNVRLGGGLHQDLTRMRKKTSNRRTVLPLKRLRVTKGTRLHVLLTKDTVRINSLHKQSIDRVGDGLRIAACDRDNIVQAVEHPTRAFLIGVQWHPEFLLYMRSHRSLFRALVQAAYRQRTGREDG